MATDIKWLAAKDLYHSGVSLSGILTPPLTAPTGIVTALTSVAMSGVEEGSVINPFIIMTKQSAQSLMDELWNCGVRPTTESVGTGEILAVKYHLEDMRDIVKSLMELKK